MHTGEDPLESVLAQLDRWRHLPKYKLEQHVDVLFGMTLPTVIRSVFKTEGEVHVIPEFPIHHRTVGKGDSNQSFNIDFAAFIQGGEEVFLVELKTDANSIKQQQLCDMRKIVRYRKFRDVIKAIPKIAKHSKQKAKYLHLVCELSHAGAMTASAEIQRLDAKNGLRGFKNALKGCRAPDMLTCAPRLVLIYPDRNEKIKADTSGFCCIDFQTYEQALGTDNPLERLLRTYLDQWRLRAGDPRPKWP